MMSMRISVEFSSLIFVFTLLTDIDQSGKLFWFSKGKQTPFKLNVIIMSLYFNVKPFFGKRQGYISNHTCHIITSNTGSTLKQTILSKQNRIQCSTFFQNVHLYKTQNNSDKINHLEANIPYPTQLWVSGSCRYRMVSAQQHKSCSVFSFTFFQKKKTRRDVMIGPTNFTLLLA